MRYQWKIQHVKSVCSLRSNQHSRHFHEEISIMESLDARPSTNSSVLHASPPKKSAESQSSYVSQFDSDYDEHSSLSFTDAEQYVIACDAHQITRKRERDKSCTPRQNEASMVDLYTECYKLQKAMKYEILEDLVPCQTRQLSINSLNDPPLIDESAGIRRYSSTSCQSQTALPLTNDQNVGQIIKHLVNQVCYISSPTSSCKHPSYEILQVDDTNESVVSERFAAKSEAVLQGTRPKRRNDVTMSLGNILVKNSSEDEASAGYSHTSIESDEEKTTLGKRRKVKTRKSEGPYQKVGGYKTSNNTQQRDIKGNNHSEVLNSHKLVTNQENYFNQNYRDVKASKIDDHNGNIKPKGLYDRRFKTCLLNDRPSSATEHEDSGKEESDNEHLASNSSHSSYQALMLELESLVAKSTAKYVKKTFKGRPKPMVLKECKPLRPNIDRWSKFSQQSRLHQLSKQMSPNQTTDYLLNESKLCCPCNTSRPHNSQKDFSVGHFYSGFNMDNLKNQPVIVYGTPVRKYQESGLRNADNEKFDYATQTEKYDHHMHHTSMNYGQVSGKSFIPSLPPVITELSIEGSTSFLRRVDQSEIASKTQGISQNCTNIQQAHLLNKSGQDVCSHHETSQLNIGIANVKSEHPPACDVTYLETPLNDTNETKSNELEGCVSSEDEEVMNVLKDYTSRMPPHLPIVGDSVISQGKSKIFTTDLVYRLAGTSQKNLLSRFSSGPNINLSSPEDKQSTWEESFKTTDESRLAIAKSECFTNSSTPNTGDSPENVVSRYKHLKVPLSAYKSSRRLENGSGIVSEVVSGTDNTPQSELSRQMGTRKKDLTSKWKLSSCKCHSAGKLKLDRTVAVQTSLAYMPRRSIHNDMNPGSAQEGIEMCSGSAELSSYSCQKGRDGDETNRDDSEVGYYDSSCDSTSNSSDLENMSNEIPDECDVSGCQNGTISGFLPSEQCAFTLCENEKMNKNHNQLVERLSLNEDNIQCDCDYKKKGKRFLMQSAKFLFSWLTRWGKNMESKSCSNTHLLTKDLFDK